MNDQRLEQIANELLETDCTCEMNDVLKPLSIDDLKATYDDFMDQYGHELAFGAFQRSEWIGGNLIINANQPSICFVHTALEAIRAEMERRKVAEGNGTEPCSYGWSPMFRSGGRLPSACRNCPGQCSHDALLGGHR